MTKRKQHGPGFKARVVLKVAKDEASASLPSGAEARSNKRRVVWRLIGVRLRRYFGSRFHRATWAESP